MEDNEPTRTSTTLCQEEQRVSQTSCSTAVTINKIALTTDGPRPPEKVSLEYPIKAMNYIKKKKREKSKDKIKVNKKRTRKK